jgi:hypothetical protein
MLPGDVALAIVHDAVCLTACVCFTSANDVTNDVHCQLFLLQKHSDKDLTCQYRRHHPIFYINPLREEVLNAQPRIVFYHNAVTDSEIEKIREMATPRVQFMILCILGMISN